MEVNGKFDEINDFCMVAAGNLNAMEKELPNGPRLYLKQGGFNIINKKTDIAGALVSAYGYTFDLKM